MIFGRNSGVRIIFNDDKIKKIQSLTETANNMYEADTSGFGAAQEPTS